MSRRETVRKVLCSLGYKKWSAYPDDVQNMLIKEYSKGEEACDFAMIVDGVPPRHALQKYTVNFEQLTQTNMYSGKARKIKLVKTKEKIENESQIEVMDGKLANARTIDEVEALVRQTTLESRDSAAEREEEEREWEEWQNRKYEDEERERERLEEEWEERQRKRNQEEEEEREREWAEQRQREEEEDERRRRREEEEWEEKERHRLKKEEEERKKEKRRLRQIEEEEETQRREKKESRDNQLLALAAQASEKRSREKEEIERSIRERESVERERLERMKKQGKPQYKLVFNSPGRSEALRLAMLYMGIPFEEEFVETTKYRDTTLTGCLTVFKDGYMSRSNWAMLRYLGHKHGMYPESFEGRTQVDEMIWDLRDFTNNYYNCNDPDEADQLVADTMMPKERALKDNHGEGLVGKLSIADFELVATTKSVLSSKTTDAEMFAEAFPNITRLCEFVSSNDDVRFYDSSIRSTHRSSTWKK